MDKKLIEKNFQAYMALSHSHDPHERMTARELARNLLRSKFDHVNNINIKFKVIENEILIDGRIDENARFGLLELITLFNQSYLMDASEGTTAGAQNGRLH